MGYRVGSAGAPSSAPLKGRARSAFGSTAFDPGLLPELARHAGEHADFLELCFNLLPFNAYSTCATGQVSARE
jgi:hypothetical protein